MRIQREKTVNAFAGNRIYWSIKDSVKEKEISPQEGEMLIRRLANALNLPELLPETIPTLKQQLQEKHPDAKEKMNGLRSRTQTAGMLSRLTARLKRPTPPPNS